MTEAHYPDCALCKDTGLLYWDDTFAFCKCAAGVAREEKQPECVNEANRNNQRLREMFKNPCGPNIR